jgi:FkbM family methyltransferase
VRGWVTTRFGRWVRRALHALLGSMRKAGIESSFVRDRSLKATGVRFDWRREENALRGAIHEHRLDGRTVWFFVADEDDALAQDQVAGRWYEPRELEFIRSALGAGAFVDVGAGLGNHSVFAGLVLGVPKIVAFEPVPLTWRICSTNIRLNDLGARTTVHRFGLSDSDQAASISRKRQHNIGATAVSPDSCGTLQLRRGDPVLAGEQIGFLKIDVEGHEMRVLEGLVETIARQRPAILLEVDHGNRGAFDGWRREADYEIRGEIRRSENTNLLLLPRS